MSDSKTTAAPPAKGRSKLLMIGVPVVVVLLGGAGAGWWYVRDLRAAPADKQSEKAEEEANGLVSFEPFTVNLADPGGRRYLRVALGLVLPDEKVAKETSDEELVMSRVRSALIEVLAEQLATDLATADGRASLKKTISETASHAGHMEVRDVLFREFVVQ